MIRGSQALFALLVAALPLAGAHAAPAVAAVTWGASIDVDLDGDGKADAFRVGRRAAKLVVEAQVGGKAQALEFDAADYPCTPATFVAGCGTPKPALSTYVLDDNAIADAMMFFEIEDASSFVGNGRACAVVMPVGETDPVHFYWNPTTHRLESMSL